MIQVFISYAREDFELAKRLYDELKSIDGIEPWLDKECLLPGMKWRPATRKAIREADFFLALLSRQSTGRRGFAHSELNDALEILREFPDNQIYLIPIRLDACEMPIEELKEIQRVDFFPEWDEGLEKVLHVLRANRPVADIGEKKAITSSELGYHYRVGMADLDGGLVNLPQVANRLNAIQDYFLFTCPKLPPVMNAVHLIGGFPNLLVSDVPISFYSEHRYLNVDLIACLTKYPLAFRQNNQLLYNYFAGPGDVDERFMFISTDSLYEFTKQAGCTFEKGIAYLIVSQLVVYFTDWGYHDDTLGCVMDFCENRSDIVEGLARMRFCSWCRSQIQNPDLKEALEAMLADDIRI